jgi:radical SAM superfamily enzyme YgiQ (UPF0313 family)
LYVPDNQVTKNFVPHLWPFLLKELTPRAHEVTIIDGNAQRYSPDQLAQYVRDQAIDLVGLGFMTRMAEAAYQSATAIRAVPNTLVVMGGPHVTEVPEEPLGRTGLPQCADAVVRGEADELWPLVVEDASRKQLRPIYQPAVVAGRDVKPTLRDYPVLPWDQIDLSDFNLLRFVPTWAKDLFRGLGFDYEAVYVVPMETGRGCPYGCDFCTVTGFFGDQIRFRGNENVLAELQRLKAMASRDNALVIVCFVDDNLAINPKRTKALLRTMIEHDLRFPWWGQVSINLLRDPELVHLMAESGARSVLVGLESLSTESLKAANKGFNKPTEYASVLGNLAQHDILVMASFIFGMEADTPGVASRTVEAIESWPPGLPIFGVLTPYPATPLYTRLQQSGRLTRPSHWLDFSPFKAAYLPKLMSSRQVEAEVREAWIRCYEPTAVRRAQDWMIKQKKPFRQQLTLFVTRLFFRGIYFPQTTRGAWASVLLKNTPTIVSLLKSGWRERVA